MEIAFIALGMVIALTSLALWQLTGTIDAQWATTGITIGAIMALFGVISLLRKDVPRGDERTRKLGRVRDVMVVALGSRCNLVAVPAGQQRHHPGERVRGAGGGTGDAPGHRRGVQRLLPVEGRYGMIWLSWELVIDLVAIQVIWAITAGAIAAPLIWYEARKRTCRAALTRGTA